MCVCTRDVCVFSAPRVLSAGHSQHAFCICIYYGSPLAAAKAGATLPGVQQNEGSNTILKTLQYIHNRFHNTLSVCLQATTLLSHIYNTKSICTCAYVIVCVYACVCACVSSRSLLFHNVYFYQFFLNEILLLA